VHKVACYIAVFGAYDDIRPPLVIDPGVRYVAFTDHASADVPAPWERVEIRPDNPTLDNRRLKALAHHEWFDGATTIYLDGVYQLRVSPAAIIDAMPADVDLWLTAPSDEVRGADGGPFTLIDEVCQIIDGRKANLRGVVQQAVTYAAAGLDMTTPAMRCGFLVRRPTPAAARFGQAWWSQIRRHTHRDQLSFHVAAEASGVRWASFDRHVRNRLVKRRKHARARPTTWA